MSKGKTTSSTTQQNEPWAPTKGYLTDALGDLSGLFQSGGLQLDHSGDWVADMTGGQDSALQGIIGAAGANNGQLGQVANSLLGLATGQTQNNNWDTVANDTVQRLMPSINSSFAGSGMTGSTLHQQNLSKGLSEGLATARTDYDNNAIQQQLGATSSLSGVLGQILGNNQAAYDAQSQYQTQQQNELDSQYQTGLLQQGSEWSALQEYLSALSGIAGLGGTRTGTETQSKSGGLLGAIGGLAGGLSGVGSIAKSMTGLAALSDRRLKQNIKRIGATDSGLPIYTYSYLGSAQTHMGVMAQEVAEVNPEAVVDMGGYLAVNYGAL